MCNNRFLNKLNLFVINGYLDTMPREIHKWFPNFFEENVIMPKYHLYEISVEILNEEIEHQYVSIMLLAMSLTEYSQRWFRGLCYNHLESYDDFSMFLESKLSTKKDSGMLLA
jgi:hypothetical protein